MASLTEKTVDLDHVSLYSGLVDAWGPSGTVGLFYFPFVWPVNYLILASTIFSATWDVNIYGRRNATKLLFRALKCIRVFAIW